MEETNTTNELDKLTLELFMNKKNVKKYLEKTDPKNIQIYKYIITK